jgi:protein-tyrosine phosphatase
MLDPDHPHMNFSKITDRIYIGTNFCCEMHFAPELLERGVTYDLSLEEDRVDTPLGGAAYLWLPIKDGSAPNEQQFVMGVSFIDSAVRTGRRVYVHCKNGHGRAPTMVAAYFIKTGMSVDDALAFIADHRPEIHVNDVQRAALHTYETTIKSIS